MARPRTRLVREAAIGREWDAWARENEKPLTGANGSDAFSFFNYLVKERPEILSFASRMNYKWEIVERHLKETGRVALR